MKKYILTRIENNGKAQEYKPLRSPCSIRVPHPDAIKALVNNELNYDGPYFEDQDEFKPAIGYTVRFMSESMDDGWWSVSNVQSYEKLSEGVYIFKTLNSTYKLEEVK